MSEQIRNRMYVDGVDLTERFGAVMLDGYSLDFPSPKTYTVDIPGGNGKLDLTDSLLGDVAYDNRKQKFSFAFPNVTNFEEKKTAFANFLHGRRYKYKLSMDSNYTYDGRFAITKNTKKTYANMTIGTIDVEIDAQPFKFKDNPPYKLKPAGGRIIELQNGRLSSRPVITTDGYTKVIFNGKQYELGSGSWIINDIVFKEGVNKLYLNTYIVRSTNWYYFKRNNITWGQLKTKPLYEWYKINGVRDLVPATWDDIDEKTFLELQGLAWRDINFTYRDVNVDTTVYVSYEWGDL